MKVLISVSNKTGIVEFAKKLSSLGSELISTGGTYNLLTNNGLSVTNILNITSYSKPLNTIIKTLYPEIYASINVNRSNSAQVKQLSEAKIDFIDMIVVNLSPLDYSKPLNNKSIDSFLESIDIGGPTMLRSAAKYYKDIIVISDPSDYNLISKELETTNCISINTRTYLMKKVFKTTYEYDYKISNLLSAL